MEDRILTTVTGIYVASEWDGENHSRIAPVCDKVVVLCDAAVETTKGGIVLTDQLQENQGLAATTGILIAVGPQAFAYDSDRLVRWEGARPMPGDRVYFQKFAGQEYTGWDGKLYRLMQDRSVAGVEIADTSIAAGAPMVSA